MIYQGDEILINKNSITFRDDRVPKSFFKNAKTLGYSVLRTGKCVFTHQIFCSRDEFVALLEISKQDKEV